MGRTDSANVEERLKFIKDYRSREWSMAELCRRFGISRITGYKWVGRYREGGVDALRDRSRAPHSHPTQILEAVEKAVLAARGEHPQWGPLKLRSWLDRTAPEIEWPAPSTIGEILRRNGLTVSRKGRQGRPEGVSNQIWAVELAECFHCLNGHACFPLTITDLRTGFLLRCQALKRPDTVSIRRLFEAAFREYGLPSRIRFPGVAPFIGAGPGGLSELTVWWIRLAIRPVKQPPRGTAGGALQALKRQTAQPPRENLREQQRAFDFFRHRRNTASAVYRRSARPYPSRIAPITYPPVFEVRRVQPRGVVRWNNGWVFVGRALTGEIIGFEPAGEGLWRAWFGSHRLGSLKAAGGIVPETGRNEG